MPSRPPASHFMSDPSSLPLPPHTLIHTNTGKQRAQQAACLEAIRLLHSVLDPPLLDDTLMLAGLPTAKGHCALAAELVNTGGWDGEEGRCALAAELVNTGGRDGEEGRCALAAELVNTGGWGLGLRRG